MPSHKKAGSAPLVPKIGAHALGSLLRYRKKLSPGELESFSAALGGGLDYPHYTRPAAYRGWDVPDVLLSGDHGRIDRWRREQSRARSLS